MKKHILNGLTTLLLSLSLTSCFTFGGKDEIKDPIVPPVKPPISQDSSHTPIPPLKFKPPYDTAAGRNEHFIFLDGPGLMYKVDAINKLILSGSSSYTLSVPSSTDGSISDNRYLQGRYAGFYGELYVTDNINSKNLRTLFNFYTINPANQHQTTVLNTIEVGNTVHFDLSDVFYNTKAAPVNDNYDRVRIKSVVPNNLISSGIATITYNRTAVRNNVGIITGYNVTGFNITALKKLTTGLPIIIEIDKFPDSGLSTYKVTINNGFKVFDGNEYFELDGPASINHPGTPKLKVPYSYTANSLPETIIFPDWVQYLPKDLLKNQKNIKHIGFNRVETIEGSLFNNMTQVVDINVESVDFLGSDGNYHLKVIGYDTFRNALKLKSIKFPPTLTHLGDQSFFNCKLLTKVGFTNVASAPKGLDYTGSIERSYSYRAFDVDVGNRVFAYVPSNLKNEYKNSIDPGGSKFRGLPGPSIKDISEF